MWDDGTSGMRAVRLYRTFGHEGDASIEFNQTAEIEWTCTYKDLVRYNYYDTVIPADVACV